MSEDVKGALEATLARFKACRKHLRGHGMSFTDLDNIEAALTSHKQDGGRHPMKTYLVDDLVAELYRMGYAQQVEKAREAVKVRQTSPPLPPA